MTQNILMYKNKALTNCYNSVFFCKFIYMHETLEYYCYIHLCNFESNT